MLFKDSAERLYHDRWVLRVVDNDVIVAADPDRNVRRLVLSTMAAEVHRWAGRRCPQGIRRKSVFGACDGGGEFVVGEFAKLAEQADQVLKTFRPALRIPKGKHPAGSVGADGLRKCFADVFFQTFRSEVGGCGFCKKNISVGGCSCPVPDQGEKSEK